MMCEYLTGSESKSVVTFPVKINPGLSLIQNNTSSFFFKPSLKPESVRFEFNVRPIKQSWKKQKYFFFSILLSKFKQDNNSSSGHLQGKAGRLSLQEDVWCSRSAAGEVDDSELPPK